jgi:hypothetical protein
MVEPSAATTEIEPSSARTAIEPVDPIGSPPPEALGAALAAGLATGEGVPSDGADVGGAGLPQAAPRHAASAIALIGRGVRAIT